jgi:MFS family permease
VFTAAMAVAAAVMAGRSPTARLRWLAWASTDLDNLRDHPLPSMIASAFLTTGSVTAWLVLAFVGLGAAGSALGPVRAAVLAASAQILGTLASEGLLGIRIRAGSVDPGARQLLDVGPSYVVVGALVAGIVTALGPWRLACAVGFGLLVPHLFGGLTGLDVTAVGHSVAVVTGAGLGFLLARPARVRSKQEPSGTRPDTEPGRRAQYAYDGSNYRVVPQAVAFPGDAAEVAALVRAAHDDRRPVTARGGGTGIAGNSVGPGLVIDFSRAMNRVLELDPREADYHSAPLGPWR